MRRSSGVVVLLALILNAFASGRVQASREAAPLGERRRGTAEPLPLFQTSRSARALRKSGRYRSTWHNLDVLNIYTEALEAAALAYENAPLTELNGFPASTPPLTPCWTDSENRTCCMPRFYLIGVPKCGTTTLYYSLVRHPLVAQPFGKESHFWSRSLNMGADYFAKNFTIRAGEKFLEAATRRRKDWSRVVYGDFSPENFARWSWPLLPEDVVQKATLRLSERTAGDSQPAAGALAALDRPVSDMRDGGKAWDTLMKRLSSEAPADDSGGDGAGDGAAASRPGVRNASAWENEMLRHVPLPEALRYRQPGAKIVLLLRSPPQRTASHYHHQCNEECKSRAKAADAAAPRKTEGDACLCPINAENFGRLMRDALGFMQACIDQLGVAPCVIIRGTVAEAANMRRADGERFFPLQNRTLRLAVGWVQDSLYAVHMQTWLMAYPRKDILVVPYDRMMGQPKVVLKHVFDHIGIGDLELSEDQWGAVLANINVEKSDAKLDGVHGTSYGTSTLGDDTAKLLHRFFAPHNLVLAQLLQDDAYARWNERSGEELAWLVDFFNRRGTAPYAGE